MSKEKTLGAIVALGLTGFALAHGSASELSLRAKLNAMPVTSQLGGNTTRPLENQDAFSFQAANAPRNHQRPFSFGNRLFNTNWVEAPASVKSFDGLGPLFNRVSCSGCHTKDGRGQPPDSGEGPMDSMLLRISIAGTGPHGAPNPVPGYGDQLSERATSGGIGEGIAQITYVEMPGQFADGESYSLRKPSYALAQPGFGNFPNNTLISARVAPQMIGLGLLEAVPVDTLQALADSDDANGDGISGRMNTVWDADLQKPAVGRFGWKASQPNLRNQNAAAALGDVGLTTSVHADENCEAGQSQCQAAVTGGSPELNDEFLNKLTLYTQTLAVPAQRNSTAPDVVLGAAQFNSLGCTPCHMPTLQTGGHDLPELSEQIFHPYTDLLLHDMGEGLADSRPDFAANGTEWRTPPLWGLGLVPHVNGHNTLLHDGRARGFAEAILWHGGEAEAAKEIFRTATKADREAILAFLKSL
jgi:CxxC motif-containing protein (DUF1111 family)